MILNKGNMLEIFSIIEGNRLEKSTKLILEKKIEKMCVVSFQSLEIDLLFLLYSDLSCELVSYGKKKKKRELNFKLKTHQIRQLWFFKYHVVERKFVERFE